MVTFYGFTTTYGTNATYWGRVREFAGKKGKKEVSISYWWGIGILVGSFAASMVLAFSPAGYAITNWVIAGTPGAERPIEAYLPPGFTM